MAGLVSVLLLFSTFLSVRSFYLPGAAPHNYAEGEKVELFVNALTPMRSATNDKIVCDSVADWSLGLN